MPLSMEVHCLTVMLNQKSAAELDQGLFYSGILPWVGPALGLTEYVGLFQDTRLVTEETSGLTKRSAPYNAPTVKFNATRCGDGHRFGQLVKRV